MAECNKLLFLRVPNALADDFLRLTQSRDPGLEDWILANLGDHPLNVLPTPDDGASTLFGVEVLAEALPLEKNYKPAARKILGILGEDPLPPVQRMETVGEPQFAIEVRNPATVDELGFKTPGEFRVAAVFGDAETAGAALERMRVPLDRVRVRELQARRVVEEPRSPEPGGFPFPGYESPVRFPREALGEARFYRVPDELRTAAILPEDWVRRMSRSEQVAYLRRALALDDQLPEGYENISAVMGESRRAAARGEHGLAQAKLKEAEAATARGYELEIRKLEMEIERLQFSEEVARQEALESSWLKAGADLGRKARLAQLRRLPLTREGEFPLEEFRFAHPDAPDELQLWISHRQEMVPDFVLRDPSTGQTFPPGSEAAARFSGTGQLALEPVPTGKTVPSEFFQIDIVEAGKPASSIRANTAGEVAELLEETIFKDKMPRRSLAFPYIHKNNPSLGASIVPGETPGTVRAKIYRLVDEPDGTVTSGAIDSEVSPEYTRPEEAIAFLQERQFRSRGFEGEDASLAVITSAMREVPDPRAANRNTLQALNPKLKAAIEEYLAVNGHIPEPLAGWMRDWGEAWVKQGGEGAPFTGRIREGLGAVVPEDLPARSLATPAARGLGARAHFWPSRVYQARDKVATPHERAILQELAEIQRQIDEFSPAVGRGEEVPGALEGAAMVEYSNFVELPNGAIHRIVDSQLDTPEMLVESFDGRTFTVDRSKAKYLEGELRHELYWRKVQAVWNGEPVAASFPAPRGAGEVERQLGLLGIQDEPTIRAGITRALNETLDRFRQDPKSKNWIVSEEDVDQAVAIYRRGKELGMDDALKQSVPRDLEPALNYAVYRQVMNEFGGDPAADLIARTELGLLTSTEREALDKFANKYGAGGIRSPRDQIRELVRMGQHAPEVARQIFKQNSELGFLRFMRGQEMPQGGVTFRKYALPDNLVIGPWSLPRKLADAHPTWRGMRQEFYHAEAEARGFVVDNFVEIRMDLERRYSPKEIAQIRELVGREGINTWQDALDAGAGDNLAYGFSRLKSLLEKTRYDTIWHLLKRGSQARPLNRNPQTGAIDPRDLVKLAEAGIDADQLPQDFLLMDLVRSKHGAFSDGEIEQFIHFLQVFDDVDQFRAAVPDAPDKFLEQFTFWKEYGVDNYFPFVHEGSIPIMRNVADATGKVTPEIAGFAESTYDAFQTIRFGRKQGIFKPEDEVWVGEELRPVLDDLLVTVVGDKFNVIRNTIASATGYSAEETSNLLLKAGIAPGTKSAFLASARRRRAGLKPIRENPIQDLGIYISRLARARYRHRVLDAIDRWSKIDESVSNAYGVKPLGLGDPFSPQRTGVEELSQRALRNQVREYIRRALGERTAQDAWGDYVLGVGRMVANAPKELVRRALGGEDVLPLKDILSLSTFTKSGSVRELSQDAIMIQSLLRLGFSPVSAAVNLSQTWTNTAPIIGVNYTTRGMRDAMQYMWAKAHNKPLPKIPGLDVDLIDWIEREVGVSTMTAKPLAGTELRDLAHTLRITRPAGIAAKIFDTGAHWSMWMFQRAEDTNRLTALLGGYRYASQELGHSPSAARAWAEDFMNRTQFEYDALAMPQFMKGPLLRMLFQFKPFLVQQLSFTKDLAYTAAGVGRIPGMSARQAQSALAKHLVAVTVLGGLAGVGAQPLFALPNVLLRLTTGKTLDEILHDRNRKHRMRRVIEAGGSNDLWFDARDVATHGLPALMGATLGQRIAVSGQELTPYNFGPLVETYIQFFRAFNQYRQTTGSAAGTVGAALGFAGANLRVSSGFNRILGAVVGGIVASHYSSNRMEDFLNSTQQGRGFINQVVPTVMRNMFDATDLYLEGGTPRDLKLRPVWAPYQYDPMLPGQMLIASELLGLPTIETTEARAVQSILIKSQKRARADRDLFAERLAIAIVRGDPEEYWAALADATKLGFSFSYGDIQSRIERMRIPAIESIRKATPMEGRFPE